MPKARTTPTIAERRSPEEAGVVVGTTGLLLKLRGRLGLWLIKPYLEAAGNRCKAANRAGASGGSYGPHYWLCKFFALDELRRALTNGEVPGPYVADQAGASDTVASAAS